MKKVVYVIGILIFLIAIIGVGNLRTSWGDYESIHKDRLFAVTCQNHGIQISWLGIEWVSSRDNCQNI